MITNVDAVTVFNGRTDQGTRRKKFIPTVIRGASYAEAKGSTVTDNGVWSNDVQYKFRIPFGASIQEQRGYMPALKYAKLDEDTVEKHWTINKGDLVMVGEHLTETSPLHEDDLQKYAQENGLDLIRITEYADNTVGGSMFTRHWRIGGK